MTVEFFDCDQRSEQWYELRAGLPTASEFASILAKGEGKMRRSYMLRLAGERVRGIPATSYENAFMIRGREQEAEAREEYAFIADVEPKLVGFARDLDKGAGCSPDALIGDDGVLEIKTAEPHILIDLMLKGTFPGEHRAQCQGALWVTDREWVDLAVYCPRLPLFMKRAYRDDAYIAELEAAVKRFNEETDEIVERIRRYGEPAREVVKRDLERSLTMMAG